MAVILYNTVLSQTFSPCGNFLLAGNTYGSVAVYDLQKILSPGEGFTSPLHRPEYHFKLNNESSVCSMVTTDKFLVTGTVGEIHGWEWKTITSNKNPKLAWTIQIPSSRDTLEKTDVNCMFSSEGQLYAGCGDNKIYIFSLEDGKLVRTMDGHDDYIHCIHHSDTQIASASEDGTVRLWDMRQKTCTNMIQPYLSDKASRPDLGKWVGAVSVNEDWLICGGGPKLSLWHLRSMDVTTAFPIEDSGIHVANFYDDRIMAGGSSPHFYHLSYTGDVLAQIPSSSTTVYSAVHQETPFKLLCIAGSSSKIDFCTNFNYRDQILSFM
ncbi:THO complex subunit 6 [Anabrus simplex]|uniref:THO complex subunit 6 n=1 Tax=Anabrus simplex TaxID=316456 RepID=UPI0035A2E10A